MNALSNKDNVFKYLSFLILALGAALRICIYLQNRGLFLDEASVARNIYERSFSGLLHPLDYCQYAPPVFLLLIKAMTCIAGYGEYVFRFIPLVSGIGSLYLLYLLLGHYGVRMVAWYPLFLFATGLIYLRYATETKQYSSDCFVALILIYLALDLDWQTISRARFVLLWALAGSLAIWTSMPSAFILAGVGVYYAAAFNSGRDFRKVPVSFLICIIWLAQFLAYYFFILKPQVKSDYLQNFHKESFLYLLPHSIDEFTHNCFMTMDMVKAAAGYWLLSWVFHSLAILMALYIAIRTRNASVLLLVVPIALLLCAAALHQYALTPRIILFCLPLVLILVAIGYERFASVRHVRLPLLIVSFICMFNFSELGLFLKPLKIQAITPSMDFLVEGKVLASQIYVHPTAVTLYTYYTEIHPGRDKWRPIKGAPMLTKSNYDSLSKGQSRIGILCGSVNPEDLSEELRQVKSDFSGQKHYTSAMAEAFIFNRP